MALSPLRQIIERVIAWIRGLTRRPNAHFNTEVDYRKRVAQLSRYYSGEQLSDLKSVLDNQFVNPSNLKLQMSFSNIVRYITDNLANTFKNGVLVTANDEKEQDIYDKIVNDSSLDAFLKTLEKYVFLMKTVFVKVSYRDEKIALDIVTPEFVEVETAEENPQRITSIVYPLKIDKTTHFSPEGTFAHWTDTEFQIVNEKGIVLSSDENPDGVNPYNVIPVVAFRETIPVTSDFVQWPSEELITAQDSLNVKLTELNHLIKMQSFSIPVFQNIEKDNRGNRNIVIDPTYPIILSSDKDSPGDFKFVTPSPKIADLQDSIDREYLRIFSFYGIDPSQFVSSAERSSGDSWKQSYARIEEYRENMKLVYSPLVKQLFDVIREVWNAHENETLSEEGVSISIPDASLSYQSVDEKWTDYENRLKHELMTVADILVSEEEDLSVEDAIEKIRSNRSINEQIKGGNTSNGQNPIDNVEDNTDGEGTRPESEQRTE